MDLTTGNITNIKIEDEMRSSYLDYAMSVIIARALPDVRDGLKPVQRRILFAMRELGITHSGSHKKSARVVGEVLGKYHPHGDSSVYDAMVRMAQDFSMRHTLVDGQGNFGSVDNDPPAAMRYTEVRLSAIAEHMLLDIEKETVDFMPNFDASLKEPVVLPSRLPNLLVNGSAGIAVGMATNIPPHNLGEICSAINYLIDNPEASVSDLMKIVKGPDFPTGAIIQGIEGIRSAYATGHGRVVVKARAYIDETPNGRYQIIVNELPYQVNKAALIERIANLIKEKKITGISDLRDESDRQGMRIVIELKREGQPQHVLNNLYKHTPMQSSFFVNMLALVDGQPRVLSLKEALQHFISFRQEVITRRTEYELKGAKDRAHILEGLKIALDFIDEVIATIRAAKSAEEARGDLMTRFELSQLQAQAILDMQLRRLANLERQKILDEYAEVLKIISQLEDLLSSPVKILGVVKKEVSELKSKEANPRRSEINEQEALAFSEEDLIPHLAMVVTLSDRGFIKRVPAESFTPQHRGGKGIIGMVTREADTVRFLLNADTHDNLLLFTDRGRVFSIKCHEVPLDVSRVSKGLSVINLIPLQDGERVTALVDVQEFQPDWFMLMATQKGEIKKVDINSFTSVRSSGLLAMDLDKNDCLISARMGTDENDVVLVTRKGQSIRFPVKDIRTSLRASGGVRAIKLIGEDQVVDMDVVNPEAYLLVVTERGFGKITPLARYPIQKRAGSGVKTFHLTSKTGQVAAAAQVTETRQVMLISANGVVTRTPVREEDPRKGITVQGRSTQGVKLMDIKPDDGLVAITVFD
ncbi:MAG: DNA gyrase subunit A [Dehalococcoidales bacterium]|jgi:DNA gyrase subunit A|nr:DNA gyrase subunit A [Dehalococcoidales bacterium]NLE90844.1 DNA gyrase subunit A [Dehalococcoidales bacterium]